MSRPTHALSAATQLLSSLRSHTFNFTRTFTSQLELLFIHLLFLGSSPFCLFKTLQRHSKSFNWNQSARKVDTSAE